MIGRRSEIGIAVLCALVVSAFAAANSSAVGRTAYTCAKAPTGEQFSDAHCLTAHTGGTTGYKHVAIEPLNSTEVSVTNDRTVSNTSLHSTAILEGTVAGVATAITCTKVHGMGTLENKEEAGEMIAHVTGTLVFTECGVSKPAGKECIVKGNAITTKKLTSRTLPTPSKEAEIKPFEGTEFASITIEKCIVAALNNTFPVVGSLKDSLNGATVSFAHATVTTQNTLKFGGQKAGINGSLTLGMSTPVADGEAITVT